MAPAAPAAPRPTETYDLPTAGAPQALERDRPQTNTTVEARLGPLQGETPEEPPAGTSEVLPPAGAQQVHQPNRERRKRAPLNRGLADYMKERRNDDRAVKMRELALKEMELAIESRRAETEAKRAENEARRIGLETKRFILEKSRSGEVTRLSAAAKSP